MCFITNGDLNDNLKIMYRQIKGIEFRQIKNTETLDKIISKLEKDKISFCIDNLEKVKYYFCEENEDGDCSITKDACDVAEFIDRQIKELKELK